MANATGGRRFRMIFLVVATAMCGAIVAHASPLDEVPAGAQLVVLVPDISVLDAKVQAWVEATGLPIPIGDGLLAMFREQTEMREGLDESGAAMFVIPDLAASLATESAPEPVMLLPVKDRDAILGNWDEVSEPDADAVFEIAGGPQARWQGSYLLVGDAHDALASFAAGHAAAAFGERVGESGRGLIESADIAMYIDLEAMAPTLLPLIDQGISAIVTGITESMPAEGFPGGVDGITAIYRAYGEFAKGIVGDAQGVVVGADFGERGLAINETVQFRPGTVSAGYLAASGGDASGQLARLPGGKPFLFAMAVDSDALPVGKMWSALFEKVPQLTSSPMMGKAEMWVPMLNEMKDLSFAMYAPGQNAMMGGGFFNAAYAYQVADAEVFTNRMRDYLRSMDGFEQPMPSPAGGGATLTYSTSYTEDAVQIEGVSVDQFQLSAEMPPEMLQQMGPMAGIMGMFLNYGGYVATQGDQMLMTTVVTPEAMGDLIRSGKAADGLGSTGPIAAIRDEALSGCGSAMEMYIGLGGIAETVNMFIGMMGQPPIEVPADLPPIVAALAPNHGGLAYRLYVPNATTKFVMDAVTKMQGPAMQTGRPETAVAPPPPLEGGPNAIDE